MFYVTALHFTTPYLQPLLITPCFVIFVLIFLIFVNRIVTYIFLKSQQFFYFFQFFLFSNINLHQPTIFLSQTPFFTSTTPITHLMISSDWQIRYVAKTGKPEYLLRQKATGMLHAHRKHESNKNVITVCPPERRVKYAPCRKACTGIKQAPTMMSLVARERTSWEVL